MTEIITAVYEKGVLRPLRPLLLREQEYVALQIIPQSAEAELERITNRLVAQGILAPLPSVEEFEGLVPISEEEARQLAEQIGQASDKLLSEQIIEDRGEW